MHRPARLATTIVVELDSTVIGDFMLRVEDAWTQAEVAGQARDTQAELGWVFDPAYTGHGYATEAVRELLRYCFEDLGVHRVTANCTKSATHCTSLADGWTRSPTPSSKRSGRRSDQPPLMPR